VKKTVGLADRAGFLVIGNSAQVLCTTISWAGLARLLTRSGFGEYRQAWLPFNLLFPVMALGLPVSILYFLPRIDVGARRILVRRTTALLACLGGILTCALWLGAPAIAAAFHNSNLAPFIRLFAFYALLTLPIAHVQQVLVAGGRHSSAAWLTGITAALQAVATVGAAWLSGKVEWVLAAVVLSAVPMLLAGLALMEVGPPADRTKPVPSLSDHLRYSVTVALAGLVLAFGRQIGQVVVSVFHPARDFAVYAVGAFEVPVLGVFTVSVITTLVPVFSDLSHRDKWLELMRVWHESIRMLSLVVFPLFVLLFVLADQVIVLLFSRVYSESVLIFRLFLLLLPMRVTVYSALLQAAGKTRSLAIGAGGFLLVNAVLSVALVRVLGIAGPAVAQVASQYGLATYFLIEVCRAVKTGLRSVMPWAEINRLFALCAVIGVVIFPFTRLGLNPALVVSICVPLYLAAYFIALRALGLMRRSDIDLLRRWASLSVLRR
jgi:O-antigen/teichoic acid export membrane protein